MKRPELPEVERVVNGRRYSSRQAYVIAHDVWWDGRDWRKGGRNVWLLKTKKGQYFTVQSSLWEDEPEVSLKPLSEEEAVWFFEQLPVHEVAWEAAFPHMPLEEA